MEEDLKTRSRGDLKDRRSKGQARMDLKDRHVLFARDLKDRHVLFASVRKGQAGIVMLPTND